ncbi:MAG: hypothetical protein QGG36_32640 [Pirellulaceae bacterium]|jgi:hypothetical protein|nr:hypothetical protein [Pirellulaceae bacterium]
MTNEATRLRWLVYGMLIMASGGGMAARIFSVQSKSRKTPLLSANDRSRWSMIRAVVDERQFHIDDVIMPNGKRDREWYTIDMVRHRGPDGKEHYYSSKPPLFPLVVAAEYAALQRATGLRIAERPYYVVRVLLVITNLVPILFYLWLAVLLCERLGTTDTARLFCAAAACFGTFTTTYANTLNNHVPAVIGVMGALYLAITIWQDDRREWWRFLVAGLCAGVAAANELPALSFLCLTGAALLCKAPVKTIIGYGGGVAAIAAAFFAATLTVHDSWRPPYAHRSNGEERVVLDVPELPDGPLAAEIREQFSQADCPLGEAAVVRNSAGGQRQVWDEESQNRFALVANGQQLRVLNWDNWYDYDRSYWMQDKKGVDKGEPDQATYAVHVLVGHHGVFSLTPLWLISIWGVGCWLVAGKPWQRGLAFSIALLTVVCLGFYLARPLADRNYGGVNCGFRWAIWLIPLWFAALVRGADNLLSSRVCRAVALLFLAASVFSAQFAAANPWTHPWVYQYWQYLEWIVE